MNHVLDRWRQAVALPVWRPGAEASRGVPTRAIERAVQHISAVASSGETPATSVSQTYDSIPIELRMATASACTASSPMSLASGRERLLEPTDDAALSEEQFAAPGALGFE